ncbi:MAG TPA: squalene/phytoene synthase family protein, partial [Bacteroidia bacterium]|nr:squalene/phytoene synthase family protein [Bacteroidia bacterium]
MSRSFYLSLRFLPPPMRGPVSLAYLLARFSDTLADAPGLPQEERLAWIEDFRQVIQGKRERLAGDPGKLAPLLDHEGERELVKRGEELVSEYRSLPSGLREPVSEVLLTILDGQSWDLRAFSDGPFACRTGDDLLLYTYRVAGCVGEFWTRIGYAVLGERFADPGQADAMLESGRKLGQALQLTNILRDLHEDLPRGRCYLPTDGTDLGRIRPVFDHWLGVARGF